MKVYWVDTGKDPKANKYGVSEQLVLLTSRGRFVTGYWNSLLLQWEIEDTLMHKEFVVSWLEGLGKR